MTDNIKIIQDISLLYELSLSVGSSLDAQENCKNFLRILTSRKALNFAAVWLKEDCEEGEYCKLFYMTPAFWTDKKKIGCDHIILQKLLERPYLSIGSLDAGFRDFIHEKKVEKGSYAIFRLGDYGFLKLFSLNKQDGFSEIEQEQLKNVVDKFAISLEGCLAHSQLREETGYRQLAQKKLQQVNDRYADLFDNMYDALIVLDKDGYIKDANKAAKKLLGYRSDESPMINAQDIVHPGDAEKSKAHFNKLMKDGFYSDYEGRVFTKNGEVRHVQVNSSAIYENGHFAGSRDLVRDVTEQKRVERRVKESEEKYRGIIENMELGLMEVDTNHIILRPYQHFCEMTGYSAKELIGKNALELLVSSEYWDKMKTQDVLREQGKSSVYEVQLIRKDGSLMWALISGAPIFDGNGNVVGSIGVHYDLTDRKKLETDLAEAKRIAEHARLAERQFLTNMSHEIRTPMNAVIGMTHLMYETDPTPPQKEYLDSLRFSADSLMGIIHNVLDLSKIEAGELELEEKNFDLEQLLKSLQRTFQFKVRQKAISVTIDFDPDIQNEVIGDPTRLNQILTNLLGNASKFTVSGTIGVKAKLLNSPPGKYIIDFRVHDTGIGIPKEKQEEIFQNFKQGDVQVTRKYGGTGLGLTIVKQLVEIQGGSIQVESSPGEGASFKFILPLKNSGVKVTSKKVDKKRHLMGSRKFLKNLHVLVVEDNAVNQMLITKMLDLWQCKYQLAFNGIGAVAASKDKKFDLILMDIHMPEMDGVEATRLLRSHSANPNHQTPIIALTAAAMLEEKKRALEVGMNDFLTKPFSPNMLENCVMQVLGLPANDAQEIPSENKPDDNVPDIHVDLQYLFEFSNGDRIFVINLLETLLCEMPKAIVALTKEWNEGNWEGVYRVVHKLKPNFMMLGMNAQQEVAIEVEGMVKKGGIDEKILSEKLKWLVSSVERAFPILEKRKSLL